MLKSLCAVFILLSLAFAVGPAPAEIPDVLRIPAIPDENPSELLRIYTPFA